MRTEIREKDKEEILDTLIPKVRQRILQLLLTQPSKSWYLTQIASTLGLTPSSLQRDLIRLSDAGILNRTIDGGRVYFQANVLCPIHTDLRHLVEKTTDHEGSIPLFLEEYKDKLLLAVLLSSPNEPFHLIAVGRADFVGLAQAIGQDSGLRVSPENIHCYWPEEFSARLRSRQPLLVELLSRGKKYLLGTQADLDNLMPMLYQSQ